MNTQILRRQGGWSSWDPQIIYLLLAACSGALAGCAGADGPQAGGIVTPVLCQGNADCSSGSHCDVSGICVAPSGNSATSIDACEGITDAEKIAALQSLRTDPHRCANGDDNCPCGSFCNISGTCEADCIPGANPPTGFSCGAGLTCTPLGRCAPSADTPPPAVDAFALQLSPSSVTANTSAAAVLVPVTVTITASASDFALPTHPARVLYRFQGIADASPPPAGIPLVKCASSAALATSCVLDGGWTFSSGSLVSAPRTIWVQVPRVAAAQSWSLEARSEWALTPATATITAAPIAFSSTGVGHYIGKIEWVNRAIVDGSGNNTTISVPVEAIATASYVAILEPTRMLLPDGHVVLPRDTTKTTLLRWLSAGSSQYSVRLDAPFTYDATQGQLNAPTGGIVSGSSARRTLKFSLQQTGDVGVPSCTSNATCAAGSYCEPLVSLCLPGTAPASETIVSQSTAAPSTSLPSAQAAAWNGPLQTVLNANLLQLSGVAQEQIERPYCYQSSGQAGAATFARGTTLLSPSEDLACNLGGEYPQPTFELENQQHDVAQDTEGNIVTLLDTCVSDLDAQPTGPATAANLLAPHKCVSLGRFFLAFNPVPDDTITYRLKTQLLRQWLGVNAYAASTMVQDQAYNDALGASGQAPQERLAQAVDRADRGLALLLDQSARKYYVPDAGRASQTAPQPDYRQRPRPVARWTFNAPAASVPSVESAIGAPSLTCNTAHLVNARIQTSSDANPACSGAVNGVATVAGAHNLFTIVAFLDINQAGTYQILSQVTGSPTARVALALNAQVNADSTMVLSLISQAIDGTTSSVSFPAIQRDPGGAKGFGLLAVVAGPSSSYSLMQILPDGTLHVLAPTSGGHPDLAPSGTVSIAGPVTSTATMVVDEVSFWDRPLSSAEFADMGARYGFTATNESLVPLSQLPALPGNEQATGLGVHVLEAAAADLNLLDAYVRAERNIVYPQCLAGQHDALDAMLARAGRNLRTVAVLEDEAASWASIPGVASAPWFPRFQADWKELDGRRIKVMSSLESAATCKNPLGIEEEDLPLFRGAAGSSADERFFASSRFLRAAAEVEVARAANLLAAARVAYNQQRSSIFQEQQGAHDSADRILKISVDYEDRLKLYCGAPPGEDVQHHVFPLLDGFRTGAVDPTNCFLRTEQPECQNVAAVPLGSVPSTCLRGQIGARLLGIQAAVVDADNANHAFDRAVEQYDSDMSYCGRLRLQLLGDQVLLAAHQLHMTKLRADKSNWGIGFGILNGIKNIGAAIVSGGTVQGQGGITDVAGLFQAFKERQFDEDLQGEEDAYQAAVVASKAREEVAACVQKAGTEKFAIDAARDTIRRATEQTRAAMFSLADDRSTVAGIANEATGQLAIESAIDRTPPHLHYWLDQDISAYHAHMAEARRLTYLAVRAFEYEQQRTTGLRGPALAALLPEDLEAVLTPIGDAISEFGQHHPIDQGPIVLSLRDEILRLADQTDGTSRLPGTPPADPITRFRALLASDASKIYDQDGRFLGRGIRFSIKPDQAMAHSCNERVWRVTPSVQIELPQDLAAPSVVLAAANAFGSQQCGAAPGSVHLARVQPSDALLVDDSLIDLPDPRPFSTTNLQAFINMPRTTLRTLSFPSDDPSAFAGRGYYGDYVLIFPDQSDACSDTLCLGYSADVLAKMQDVLIRFDIVEENNSNL